MYGCFLFHHQQIAHLKMEQNVALLESITPLESPQPLHPVTPSSTWKISKPTGRPHPAPTPPCPQQARCNCWLGNQDLCVWESSHIIRKSVEDSHY